MDQRKYEMLMELMETQNVTGTQLARKIKMSSRTVRTLIKEINEELQVSGAHIDASKALGYQLVIDDATTYLQFLQSVGKGNGKSDLNEQDQRLRHIFLKFIQSPDYIKLDDLCEELFLSRTQIKQTLSVLREYFESYDVTLEHKAHHGIRLVGSEYKKRLSIAHFHLLEEEGVSTTSLDLEEDSLQTIKNILFSCIQNADYQISDDTAQNLITHLYIALKRMQRNQVMPLEQDMLEHLKQESEFEIAQHIMTLMAQIFHVPYLESECGYITIHLCAKKASQHDAPIIADEILTLVNDMLSTVMQDTNYNLCNDFHLQMALSQHMVPLMKRIEYKMYMKNPLLDDIKSKLLPSYEIALCACSVVNSRYICALPEDEIGYIALHFNVAIERNRKDIVKRNVLIVCSSGAGSAQLLRYHFMEHFSQYIHRLEVCSAHEMTQPFLQGFDFIFTTIPLRIEVSIPIIQIHHLIDQKDISLIADNLKGSMGLSHVLAYFNESLFFFEEGWNDKEAALKEIVTRCSKVYHLPKNYEQELLKREQIASTEYNDLIVFPHSTHLVAEETFVSITILHKPMLWTKHKVRIILFACIEKGKMKKLEEFYMVISNLISNEEYQWRLIEQPKYETLRNIIEEIAS